LIDNSGAEERKNQSTHCTRHVSTIKTWHHSDLINSESFWADLVLSPSLLMPLLITALVLAGHVLTLSSADMEGDIMTNLGKGFNCSHRVCKTFKHYSTCLCALFCLVCLLTVVTLLLRVYTSLACKMPFNSWHIQFLMLTFAESMLRTIVALHNAWSDPSCKHVRDLVSPKESDMSWNFLGTVPLLMDFSALTVLLYHAVQIMQKVKVTYELETRNLNRQRGCPKCIQRCGIPRCSYWFMFCGKLYSRSGCAAVLLNISLWVVYVVIFMMGINKDLDFFQVALVVLPIIGSAALGSWFLIS